MPDRLYPAKGRASNTSPIRDLGNRKDTILEHLAHRLGGLLISTDKVLLTEAFGEVYFIDTSGISWLWDRIKKDNITGVRKALNPHVHKQELQQSPRKL